MNRQGIHTDQFAKRAQQNGEPRRPAYGDENEENEERQQTRDDTPLSNIDLQHCVVHNVEHALGLNHHGHHDSHHDHHGHH